MAGARCGWLILPVAFREVQTPPPRPRRAGERSQRSESDDAGEGVFSSKEASLKLLLWSRLANTIANRDHKGAACFCPVTTSFPSSTRFAPRGGSARAASRRHSSPRVPAGIAQRQ